MIIREFTRVSFILIFFLTVFWYPGQAQVTDTPVANAFDSALVNFAGSAPVKHASWGFCAIDITSGKKYKAINDNLALMPASTLKPFTSAAALSLLGSDFRFKTAVSISGTVDSAGNLWGNIYVEGGGDPTLGASRFGSATCYDTLLQTILNIMQESGIRTVHGGIIADQSFFPQMQVIPSWQYEDIGNSYGAGVAGLSVNDNIVTFIYEPGRREGMPAKLTSTRPEAPYLEIISDVTTGPRGSGDMVNVYGAPLSNLRWLRGTVPAGVKSFEVSGTLPDPPYHVAFSMHEFLSANGTVIMKQPTTQLRMLWMGEADTLKRRQLLVYQSPSLAEIVYWINFRSVNMYAEAIVRTLGKQSAGDGSTEAGLMKVVEFWQKQGVDVSGMNLKDGSGLARKNIITTKTLAMALAAYTKDPNYRVFHESLPVAGESGSVANRFRRGAAKGNLRAKSGTLENVKGFSGYATTASGRKLAYSLIVNNYSGKHNDLMKEIEVLLTKMCEIND